MQGEGHPKVFHPYQIRHLSSLMTTPYPTLIDWKPEKCDKYPYDSNHDNATSLQQQMDEKRVSLVTQCAGLLPWGNWTRSDLVTISGLPSQPRLAETDVPNNLWVSEQ